MTDIAQPHHTRPWYKRPLVWLVFVVVAAALIVFGVREVGGGPTTIRYSDFLDQLDAGNIASVNFAGTQIDGHFKQPVAEKDVNNGAPLTVFRSQAPAFGDPTLLPELRKEHVAIGVGSSQWMGTGTAAVLGVLGAFLLAKPMLLLIAARLYCRPGQDVARRQDGLSVHSVDGADVQVGLPLDDGKQQESGGDSPRVGN